MQPARRLFFIFGLALAGLAADPALAATRHTAKPHTVHHVATKPVVPRTKTPAPPLPDVTLPELLVDMTSGDVLYQRNAGAPWHPASLTKLMTAYVTFQALAQGRVTLDTRVVMSRKAVSQAPASSGLKAGDSLTLKDALYVMLVKSANDMAVAVAETVAGSTEAFAAEMNATASKLGLTRTHYDNVNGLPDDGQVTTARDLAVLAIDLRRTFPQFDPIYRTHFVTLNKVTLKGNNELLTHFAGTDGMKTGFICASGLNLVATVKRGDRQLLAVVLGGASSRERDQLAAQMLSKGFAGDYQDSGSSVVNIVNDMQSPPMDMQPLLCGKQAKAYVTARLKAVPFGLKGQPNFLTDKVPSSTYAATELGAETNTTTAATSPQTPQPAEGDGDSSNK